MPTVSEKPILCTIIKFEYFITKQKYIILNFKSIMLGFEYFSRLEAYVDSFKWILNKILVVFRKILQLPKHVSPQKGKSFMSEIKPLQTDQQLIH